MNKRIKQIRTYFNMTQQEFADKIKVKRNTVATYEMGRSTPSDAAVALICRVFSVNEIWLKTGQGDMFCDHTKTDEIDTLFNDIAENDTFKSKLISALAKLDDQGWEALEKLVDLISDRDSN